MRIAAIFLIVFALACSNDERPVASSEASSAAAKADARLTPEQLGELGADIHKNPNDAERLLSQRGLNTESFEDAVRKVAEDPEASKRYAAAYKARS